MSAQTVVNQKVSVEILMPIDTIALNRILSALPEDASCRVIQDGNVKKMRITWNDEV